jgi:hypothetical protein
MAICPRQEIGRLITSISTASQCTTELLDPSGPSIRPSAREQGRSSSEASVSRLAGRFRDDDDRGAARLAAAHEPKRTGTSACPVGAVTSHDPDRHASDWVGLGWVAGGVRSDALLTFCSSADLSPAGSDQQPFPQETVELIVRLTKENSL